MILNLRYLLILYIITAAVICSSCAKSDNKIEVDSWKIIYSAEESFEKVKVNDNWVPIDLLSLSKQTYAAYNGYYSIWLKGGVPCRWKP